MEILGRVGRGVSKNQTFKAMYEAKLEFLEGWGWGHRANPFFGVCVCVGGGGGVWIFSGTTHCNINCMKG